MDIAERGYRQGGFAGLSFRDIAAALDMKSASVHYHFPHKEDLGKAVVERYTENLLDSLGAPDAASDSVKNRLARLVGAYRAAYAEGESSCLCAVLGSVSPQLPPAVQEAVNNYFTRLMTWTETALAEAMPSTNLNAAHIISALQGAMILSVAMSDARYLDEVAEDLAKKSGV
ncbi:TetR/AcrR family transcriptional regulator [Parasphingorhabdus litoris]|uniref:TetR/AcrR family transcriptional regulator n=1 Tax=Parasphingorhabdus litoris TaxID=394733 RepID=A0ABN1AWA2_9SPHN|nr:TetR/AcrR family transcriptional regulator [Parasphingorhabdus litoris]